MLKTFKGSRLVWAVLLCLVLVNGYMAVPSVAHAEHHSTHQAGTHASGICAWLCAAGQGIESFSVGFESVLHVVGRTVYLRADRLAVPYLAWFPPRGPPLLSL